MSAAAQYFAERHCPRCLHLRPTEQFKSHSYCVQCRSSYRRDRAAAIRDGTWAPKSASDRVSISPRILPGSKIEPAADPTIPAKPKPPLIADGADVLLKDAMRGLMLAYGFTALHMTLVRLEGELARSHRDALARQGWIA